jgi:tetratricopeptide (TPR) repeat protein
MTHAAGQSTGTRSPAQAAGILLLRRRSQSDGLAADEKPLTPGPGRAESALAHHGEPILDAVRHATRHAWLALEVALAGEASWQAISLLLPAADGAAFHQQMAALLDLLNVAGLPSDTPVSQRRCFYELRSARQAGLAAVDNLDEWKLEAEASCHNGRSQHQNPGAAENHALAELASTLRQAGFSQLACLVSLRLPWDESLFLRIVDFFLGRTLQVHPELAALASTSQEDAGGMSWRCLETIARLLEDRAQTVEAVLNNPDQAPCVNGLPALADRPAERLFQQGVSRYLRGDHALAAAHFTAALKLDPTDARLYAHRGDAYRMQGAYERAIADFEAALRLNPGNPAVLVSRAGAYLKAGEYPRAVADCNVALEGSPNNAWAYQLRAAGHTELGSLDLALADLTAAIGLAPEEKDAYYQRGLLHLRLRAYPSAVDDFTCVLKLDPNCVSAYQQRGDAYRLVKNYPAAIRDYGEVVRYHPSNVQAYASRGSAYRLKGDFDRALADYEQALLLEPGNARVRCSLSILFRKMGELERARGQLDEAIRLDPKNWSALYHRGKVLLLQGHCDKALVDLTKALSFNAQMSPAYLSRALVQSWLGQWEHALADSTQAVTLDANYAPSYLVRGTAHRHLGQDEAALADLTEAIRLDSRLGTAYQERSLVYVRQGEYQRALADCKEFLALDPGNAQGYLQRSAVYRSLNDLENSLLDYHRALQIDAHCLITAWDRSQAESARLRAAQRLADYIDGTRHELSAAPPDTLQVVLKPSSNASGAPARSSRQPAKASLETFSGHSKAERRVTGADSAGTAATEGVSLLETKVSNARQAAPVRLGSRGMPSLATGSSAKPAARPAAAMPPADLTPASSDGSPPDRSSETEVKDQDEQITALVLDYESETPASETVSSSSDTAAWKTTPPSPWAKGKKKNAPKEKESDSLRAGRQTARSVADKAPSALDRPVWKTNSALPRAKTSAPKDQSGFLAQWNNRRIVGAVAVIALALVAAGFWFHRSDRVRVYPARGQAFLDGKAIPNASLRLDPVWTKNPAFPRPHATVEEDGSFVLGTYEEEDGAPPGEYKVSVQLLAKTGKADDFEGGKLPRNVLPAKYGRFETSGLTVQIQAGENALPALQLKR